MQYLITAIAKWTEGGEHPHGKLPDITSDKTQAFSKTIEAPGVLAARRLASEALTQFEQSLPPQKNGNLHWRTKPEVSNITFSKVMSLT